MKLLGYTYHHGEKNLVLKSDSSLLVNRKPFFIPESTTGMEAYPILVMRIGKLGKDVAERFAVRYVDAIALGWDLRAADLLDDASQKGQSWTTAIAMDGSLPVGTMLEVSQPKVQFTVNGKSVFASDALPIPWDVVCQASRTMTLRQGDLLFCALTAQPIRLQAEDTLIGLVRGEENVFCRIK